MVLSDSLATGSYLYSGQRHGVRGVPSNTDVTAGIPLGSLTLSSSIVVTYRALIGQDASILQLVNSANAAFTFQSVAGGRSLPELFRQQLHPYCLFAKPVHCEIGEYHQCHGG